MTISCFQIATPTGDRQPTRYPSEHAAIAAASAQLQPSTPLMIWAIDILGRPVEVRGRVVFYEGIPAFFSAEQVTCKFPSSLSTHA